MFQLHAQVHVESQVPSPSPTGPVRCDPGALGNHTQKHVSASRIDASWLSTAPMDISLLREGLEHQ